MLPAAQKLMAFIERIERLEEERKSLADDIADVYRELAGDGYDKDATKVIVKIRRTDDGLSKWRGASETVDFYLSSLGMLGQAIEDRAPARTREIIEKFDAETGEITEQEQPETATQSATNEGESDAKSAQVPAEHYDLINRRRQDDTHEHVRSESRQVRSGRNIAGVAAPRVGTSIEAPAESVEISAPHSPSAAPAVEPEEAPQAPQSVSGEISDADVPMFLLKERKALRPDCLHPDNCAGYGSHTCHACKHSAAESEAA